MEFSQHFSFHSDPPVVKRNSILCTNFFVSQHHPTFHQIHHCLLCETPNSNTFGPAPPLHSMTQTTFCLLTFPTLASDCFMPSSPLEFICHRPCWGFFTPGPSQMSQKSHRWLELGSQCSQHTAHSYNHSS